MRAGNLRLLPVILGLVLSTALMANPPGFWNAALSLLILSGTLTVFAMWIRERTARSRSILIVGAFVLLVATIWLEFVLSEIESPLRWLLALALAWMVTPFVALGLTSLAERFWGESLH